MTHMINKIRAKKENKAKAEKSKAAKNLVFNIFNQFLKKSNTLSGKFKNTFSCLSLKSIPEDRKENKVSNEKISECFSEDNLHEDHFKFGNSKDLNYNQSGCMQTNKKFSEERKNLLVRALLKPKLAIRTESQKLNCNERNKSAKTTRHCSSSKNRDIHFNEVTESVSDENSYGINDLEKDSKSKEKYDKPSKIYSSLTIIPHKIQRDETPSCPLPPKIREQILSCESPKELKLMLSASKEQRKISSRNGKRRSNEIRGKTPCFTQRQLSKKSILAFI